MRYSYRLKMSGSGKHNQTSSCTLPGLGGTVVSRVMSVLIRRPRRWPGGGGEGGSLSSHVPGRAAASPKHIVSMPVLLGPVGKKMEIPVEVLPPLWETIQD